jgi:hypothetical protein
MKTFKSFLIGFSTVFILSAIGVFILITSSFDVDPIQESSYSALLMSRTELEKSIQFQEAKLISNIGKIYSKDSRIYITEKYKGIHVIDNTNPASPVKIGFIRVPGCLDLAIKNNSLYVDNSVDLVTIDISNLPQIKVTGRLENVFPEPLPPDLTYIPNKYSQDNRPANTVIVEWKKSK